MFEPLLRKCFPRRGAAAREFRISGVVFLTTALLLGSALTVILLS